jgi:hypothetical protein
MDMTHMWLHDDHVPPEILVGVARRRAPELDALEYFA